MSQIIQKKKKTSSKNLLNILNKSPEISRSESGTTKLKSKIMKKDWNNQVLAFDFYGPFAYYRVPRTNRLSLSYSFPPRTAVIGLIAGILGKSRNSYWLENSGLANVQIAIEILKEGTPFHLRVNYEQTKPDLSRIQSKLKLGTVAIIKTKNVWGKQDSRGFSTINKLQYYRDVRYRIYCRFLKADPDYSKLKEALIRHHYVYPPFLGNVNLFAQIDYLGEFNLKALSKSAQISSIIPRHSGLSVKGMDLGDYKVVFNVPVAYTVRKASINQELHKLIPNLNLFRIMKTDYMNYLVHSYKNLIEVEFTGDVPIFALENNEPSAGLCFR